MCRMHLIFPLTSIPAAPRAHLASAVLWPLYLVLVWDPAREVSMWCSSAFVWDPPNHARQEWKAVTCHGLEEYIILSQLTVQLEEVKN